MCTLAPMTFTPAWHGLWVNGDTWPCGRAAFHSTRGQHHASLRPGFPGFGGIAGAAAGIAKILFVVFLILAIISFFRRAR